MDLHVVATVVALNAIAIGAFLGCTYAILSSIR